MPTFQTTSYGPLIDLASVSSLCFPSRVKVRQQLAHMSPTPTATPKPWWTTLSALLAAEGPRSIYKGLSASLVREGTYSGIRMGGYDAGKAAILAGMGAVGAGNRDGAGGGVAVKLGGGLVSGMIGAAVANPADLVSPCERGSTFEPLLWLTIPRYFAAESADADAQRDRLSRAPRRDHLAQGGRPARLVPGGRADDNTSGHSDKRPAGNVRPVQALVSGHCLRLSHSPVGPSAEPPPPPCATARSLMDEFPHAFPEGFSTHFAASGMAGLAASAISAPGE